MSEIEVVTAVDFATHEYTLTKYSLVPRLKGIVDANFTTHLGVDLDVNVVGRRQVRYSPFMRIPLDPDNGGDGHKYE